MDARHKPGMTSQSGCLLSDIRGDGILLFQRFQIRDDVADLTGSEAEFRHVRVAGDDAFGERLLQRLDRITLMQRTERRGGRQRALADALDCVAACAIGLYDGEAALRLRRQCRRGGGREAERSQTCRDAEARGRLCGKHAQALAARSAASSSAEANAMPEIGSTQTR